MSYNLHYLCTNSTFLLTCLRGGAFIAGSEAIKRGIIAVQDHGVNWVGLLQLKQKLLHRLDGVVATQVDDHLFNLKIHRKYVYMVITYNTYTYINTVYRGVEFVGF